ncbi:MULTISPECIES: TRAP transporter substrate-binding protein [Oligella]|uniref:TRAP transporter substrate-binding protein n=1 Tax=Oligella TaxID=90243 RepID=UPI000372D6D8|nr:MULTISPECIES: TRAP transporter substrate-binding protein [Oligella]OFV47432.1 C4-dicarboxylate ABC transporter substrate-binding protein [Oligella sp. HMSC09E12]SUA64256.1 Extracytoplasmic solute receptor protein yiaO [Oligella urethralis]
MKLNKLFKKTVVGAFGFFLATAVSAATFKVAIGDAAGGTQHELGKAFAASLKEKTDGKYTADLFPNSQLGDEQDTVNDAAMGLLDFSILAINNITPFSPSVAILTLPYMIQSLEDAKQLTQGDVGKELTENTIRDAGVRIIGWSYSGFRVLTNSKRPVKTLDDLKGMVIRVPKNELMIATYKSWGINPSPLAWNETFTALQQRVVDGQDNPYITVAAMKFDEVQKYITNIRYLFSLEPLIVSEQVFQSQSPEVQQAILDAGMEATEHSYQFLQDTEQKIKEELVAKGMEINDPANDEKEWIEAATNQVWPKFYDQVGGKERLDKILKSLGR